MSSRVNQNTKLARSFPAHLGSLEAGQLRTLGVFHLSCNAQVIQSSRLVDATFTMDGMGTGCVERSHGAATSSA
jgi:hypothetical protein